MSGYFIPPNSIFPRSVATRDMKALIDKVEDSHQGQYNKVDGEISRKELENYLKTLKPDSDERWLAQIVLNSYDTLAQRSGNKTSFSKTDAFRHGDFTPEIGPDGRFQSTKF